MTRQLTLRGLIGRSLAFHARSYLYTVLAAATATAIVAGALLVGDSVRGSLAARVLERLGPIDHALISRGLLREGLAADLAASAAGAPATCVPILALRGAVTNADSGERASDVAVWGVPPEFLALEPRSLPVAGGSWRGRQAAINASLAAAVRLQPGGAILLHVRKADEIPAEHALGRRAETVQPLRLAVETVLEDKGLALFGLDGDQRTPRNVFVPLADLQRLLRKQGLASGVLIASGPEASGGWRDGVARCLELEDAALRLVQRPEKGYAAVESRELLVPAGLADLARRAAAARGLSAEGVLTYLANSITRGERSVPYSMVAAVETLGGARLEPGTIALNEWAAEDLGASPGDAIGVTYFAVGPEHELIERTEQFRLARIVPLEGEAADPGWTPEYPGVTDADSLRRWDPPFPVDRQRIRQKDEDYWTARRTTPKGFVALADGQRLWGSRFGDLTAVRVRAPEGAALEPLARDWEASLRGLLEPAAAGIELRAIRDEGLAAAQGATDFAVLFLSFSSFLIVSALVLLSMVFRLALDRRGREFGLLAAVGLPPRRIRGMLCLEGGVLVLEGMLLGIGGALGYAGLLVTLLRTWWSDAVQAPFLRLHTQPLSLGIGGAVSVFLGLGTLLLVAWRVSRQPARTLLARGRIEETARPPGRQARAVRWIAALVLVLGAATILAAGASGWRLPVQAAFFGGGALLLAALLCAASALLASRRRVIAGGRGAWELLRVGASHARRAPGRSLTSIVLIASAAFVIVTVAALQRDPAATAPRLDSGNGGFALVGRAAIPLTLSLRTPAGREALGIAAETSRLLDAGASFALRRRRGDDASCLNLYQPRAPAVLGAPPDLIARGGFAWGATLAETEAERQNPWRLLERRFPDGAIAAVADANTAMWILKRSLGEDVTIRDSRGVEQRLRLVGFLAHAIFQGELVVAEERLVEAFPDAIGAAYHLFEAAPGEAAALAAALERDLAGFGFDVETTGEVLAAYQAVENTYLSTFQVLGGLGLLLGTVGLGAVLLRNASERRGELALLRALGFSSRHLAWLLLGETLLLLLLGIGAGAGAAVVAVLPAARSVESTVSWAGIAMTLGLILLVGIGSSALAVRAALRAPLIEALRGD